MIAMATDFENASAEVISLTSEAEGLNNQFSIMVIHDQVEFDQSGEMLKEVKAKIKEVESRMKSQTDPINLALKRIREHFRKPLDLLSQADSALRKARITFQQEQERLRMKEEARLRELAMKEEEKKRKQLEAKALKAESKGDILKADELREKANEVFVPAPIVESRVEKTEGIAMRKNWKARVIAEKLIPREFLMVDEKKLGQYARAMKGMAKVSGVMFYAEDVEAVRL